MKERKICPLISMAAGHSVPCRENECAWWTHPWTTEIIRTEGMCAMEAIAMKNSEGHYVV
jgi:hypothetical protein